MTLREVLHAHIPSLSASSTFRDAIDKMDIYQFPALVILDADDAPLAVITEGDLSRAVSAQGALVALSDEPAIKYATERPVCESADTEISDALHKMLMSGLTILPVMDSGAMIGIVLRVDLMQALLSDALHSEEVMNDDQ